MAIWHQKVQIPTWYFLAYREPLVEFSAPVASAIRVHQLLVWQVEVPWSSALVCPYHWIAEYCGGKSIKNKRSKYLCQGKVYRSSPPPWIWNSTYEEIMEITCMILNILNEEAKSKTTIVYLQVEIFTGCKNVLIACVFTYANNWLVIMIIVSNCYFYIAKQHLLFDTFSQVDVVLWASPSHATHWWVNGTRKWSHLPDNFPAIEKHFISFPETRFESCLLSQNWKWDKCKIS